MREKISCVIPVYNEGKRTLGVLSAVLANDLVDEVIVVDDGSTDETKKLLAGRDGIKLVSYAKNRGKSFAVMTGLKQSKNSLVLMLDSDLVGLKSKDISELIRPVIAGEADMSITIKENSFRTFKLLGLDFVSGERVFHKKILGDLDEIGKLRGFGLEAYINKIVVDKKLRLKVVNWRGTISPRKSVKFGWLKGTLKDWDMVRQIIATITLRGLISQILKMRALRVRN